MNAQLVRRRPESQSRKRTWYVFITRPSSGFPLHRVYINNYQLANLTFVQCHSSQHIQPILSSHLASILRQTYQHSKKLIHHMLLERIRQPIGRRINNKLVRTLLIQRLTTLPQKEKRTKQRSLFSYVQKFIFDFAKIQFLRISPNWQINLY